jgi:hypothetical protein
VACALGPLIQDEHAVVGPRHVAGLRHLAAADQADIREGVMRGATGARGDPGGAGAGEAGDAVDAGGVEGAGQGRSGRMVVSRCASIDLPAPGGPSSSTLGSQCLHPLQLYPCHCGGR